MERVKCCAPEHNGIQDEIQPEIVFGVHPEVQKRIRGSLAVISEKFCFCLVHWPIWRETCLGIIKEVCREDFERVSHASQLLEGLGCWITLSGSDVDNFQLPYGAFESIYEQFYKQLLEKRSSQRSRLRCIDGESECRPGPNCMGCGG